MAQAVRFSIDYIRSEVRHRLEAGKVLRSQPVSALGAFYAPAEWKAMCEELELLDVRLCDPLAELLGREEWAND
ncbi:MAG: DUF4327 family protein [Aphanocapsa lilacina HA4352-LM1]|jgi:hypothetical protein|uniref:DUF4327 family protein n=1 Tax=Gloeobacter morelensis MG652769 TaxID=2781736 RepID=A0ABY3PQY0_9CYAN|nr:DUF4327 family protein [Gloeobacter morelensis]MBW4696747.1 DUF4327 family protein [Aphanocapsa lilacina HA4352-LM1]UFP96042.1 DUF4327 family protein [Gloeobacter morelensis MG652769]